MKEQNVHNAMEARRRLTIGNEYYREHDEASGDISRLIRKKTADGQNPFAVVITCSDSRVIPESIFACGIDDLFVVRVAGNVIDSHQLGSIEYAVSHLDIPYVLVLGHTGCGAVAAAISGHAEGFIRSITEEIQQAIGDEKDDYRACCLNVEQSAESIRHAFRADHIQNIPVVEGAVYDLAEGSVTWLSSREENGDGSR